MAKISKFKYLGPERVGNGVMETSETVDRGTICGFNGNGKTQEINDTAGWKFAGIAKHGAGDTDEPTVVEMDYGSVFFYAVAAAAQADVGSPVYASGEGTIAKTSTNDVLIGRVVDVEVGVGWWIDPLLS